MRRGFYGMGIFGCKTEANIGTLWRSAHNFGASFIFTIGRRYKPQDSDTTKAWKTIPLYNYKDFDDFYNHLPRSCRIIAVEQSKDAIDLSRFIHPEQCIYLLGAEDFGIPKSIIERCHGVVYIDTPMCLNVATAGSIIMYDRSTK